MNDMTWSAEDLKYFVDKAQNAMNKERRMRALRQLKLCVDACLIYETHRA